MMCDSRLITLSSCAIGRRTFLKEADSGEIFFTILSSTLLDCSKSRLVSEAMVSGVAVNLGGACGGFWYLAEAMAAVVRGLVGSFSGEMCAEKRPRRGRMRGRATVKMKRAARKRAPLNANDRRLAATASFTNDIHSREL